MMLKRNVLLFLAFFICVNVGNSRRASKKRQHVDQTCTYEQRIDVAIEFEESTKRGAKLLDAVTKDNLDSCQENCCQLDGCTLALFHLTNASENCYLIRCHPIEVCSYTDLESFSVSVVSTDDGQIDTNIDEEDYVAMPWPELFIAMESDTDAATTPNSKPLTSNQPLTSTSSETSPEKLLSLKTTLSPETTLETTTDIITDSKIMTTLPPESSDIQKQTSTPIELSTLSLSETSSNPSVQPLSTTTLLPLAIKPTVRQSSTSVVPHKSVESSTTPTTISSSSTSVVPKESGETSTTIVGQSSTSVVPNISGKSSTTPTTDRSSSTSVVPNTSGEISSTSVSGESSSLTVTGASLTPLKPSTTVAPRITTPAPTTTLLPSQPTTTDQQTTTVATEITKSTTTETRYVEVTELFTDATTISNKNVSNVVLNSEVAYNKLSSNGALIASLCFGVLFACAICVLLGKRWYEGYQRRHYSKVDYLINGMYN